MNAVSTVPVPATPDVCTYGILIDGQEIPTTLHIVGIVVNRELNKIPTATLQIDDGEASKGIFENSSAATFLPGKPIEIELGYRSTNETVFKGRIINQRIRVRKDGSRLHVECQADAVKATANRHSKYFADVKDSDIMEQLLDDNGLARDVAETVAQLKAAVQYDCTDWDFLLCRAEANGQVIHVTDDAVRISKPALSGKAALNLAFGATVLELDAEIDARWQSKGIKATSWKAADQAVIEADATEPDTPDAGNITAADLAKTMGDSVRDIRHGGAVDEAQLQAWADARLMRMRLARIRGRARCQGIATVTPDALIEITGIGDRFGGKLYVSGVRHTVSGGNWETDLQFGLSPQLAAETFVMRTPAASGLLPAATGLQMGIVTALEGDPDGEDRIKCHLPIIATSDEGVWARLATLDAGNGRGAYFRPEIGDEVVVGFINDDPRHAVIVGMCHSSANPVPVPATDDNHRKGYLSREGLKLDFDDETKTISVETAVGNKIVLSEDSTSITMEDQNGNKIVMDESGITIESAKDLVLKAASGVTLSGMSAEFSADQSFKVSSSGSMEVSGAQTKLNGDAMTIIKGGMVQIN